jgi:hypothetical protein
MRRSHPGLIAWRAGLSLAMVLSITHAEIARASLLSLFEDAVRFGGRETEGAAGGAAGGTGRAAQHS